MAFTAELASKVTAAHLGRDAYVYVRQSTLTQMREHTESLERQYELASRAQTLGWPPQQVVVVDEHLERVARHDDEVEAFGQLDGGEVAEGPVDVGAAPCLGQHAGSRVESAEPSGVAGRSAPVQAHNAAVDAVVHAHSSSANIARIGSRARRLGDAGSDLFRLAGVSRVFAVADRHQ